MALTLITRRSKKTGKPAKPKKKRIVRRRVRAKGKGAAPAPKTGTQPARGRKAASPKPRAVTV